ncbi:unnamed protein product [Paramecium octaurelia]|uniref:Uncharacterized protein n=1 Tax=Paramecium octaurelia TaxID=43137 RepID=A0A8S1WEJ5_PAROT|nr:unnamed protein product [Paramecium octaurelia]
MFLVTIVKLEYQKLILLQSRPWSIVVILSPLIKILIGINLEQTQSQSQFRISKNSRIYLEK